jgi:uncharacterized metal-binding protein
VVRQWFDRLTMTKANLVILSEASAVEGQSEASAVSAVEGRRASWFDGLTMTKANLVILSEASAASGVEGQSEASAASGVEGRRVHGSTGSP